MRILGVDLGKRRVGLALSDETQMLATALETLDGRDRDGLVGALRERIRTHGIAEVVVGHPRRTDGTVGPEARAAEQFAERLRTACEVEVHLQDERLTSVQANRAMQEAGARGRERREAVDRVAAVLILQAFLDRRRNARRREHEDGL